MNLQKSRKDFIDSIKSSMANYDWENKYLEDIVF